MSRCRAYGTRRASQNGGRPRDESACSRARLRGRARGEAVEEDRHRPSPNARAERFLARSAIVSARAGGSCLTGSCLALGAGNFELRRTGPRPVRSSDSTARRSATSCGRPSRLRGGARVSRCGSHDPHPARSAPTRRNALGHASAERTNPRLPSRTCTAPGSPWRSGVLQVRRITPPSPSSRWAPDDTRVGGHGSARLGRRACSGQHAWGDTTLDHTRRDLLRQPRQGGSREAVRDSRITNCTCRRATAPRENIHR